MSAYMKVWWWAYALPLVACVALAFKNINFIFVAIILLFLVFTMILFFVVVYYGIVPESRYSTLPKEMEMDDSGIHLRLKKRMIDDASATEDSTPDYEIEESTIEWGAIDRIEAKDECMLLMFKRPRFSFLAVPYDAFEDETHMQATLSVIRSGIG